jgi:tRNA (cmo5U34)-methyltransferase
MAKDFNNPMVVESYDEHIRKLIPGYELFHSQVNALLKTYVPAQANILVVGCGTGYELQYLAEQFPQWHFTAIDPAPNMIDKAKKHIDRSGLASQIECIVGDTSTLKNSNKTFDAALAILVSHFVPVDVKAQFFQDIANSLSNTAICLSVELTGFETLQQLESLKTLTLASGLNVKQVQVMADRITQDFALVSAEEIIELYQQAGFSLVKSFAQVLNYYGFIGFKP